jgi:hypothetical protein
VLVRGELWYQVNNHDSLRLVIVRAPGVDEPDHFFVTTGLRHHRPDR